MAARSGDNEFHDQGLALIRFRGHVWRCIVNAGDIAVRNMGVKKMSFINGAFRGHLSACLLIYACCASGVVQAADPVCDVTNGVPSPCVKPDIGDWDTWRSVLQNKTGSPQPSEAAAVEDAANLLSKTYPCGLSYAVVEAPYAESGKILDWVAKEDAARIVYVGYASGANGVCQASTRENTGTVVIRRERRVHCPRGYTWLMRDDQPTVCFRD